MDAVFLARLQFGLTIAFHYVFPPLSIGLGLILVLMESLWLRTRNPAHREMTRFWVRIFALIFSIGVATGIVMEFQFGTNWSTYSRFVGDVFGSALAAEGIFAFFLESGFLALLIFGWDRVGPKTHFLATLMVALGSTFSALWIIVANSWMQTPDGYHIVTGPDGQPRAEVLDFTRVLLNPTTLTRVWHTLMGCWQAGAWLVISVSAFYLLKKRHIEFAKTSIRIALTVAMAASLLQLISGHESAKATAIYQPAKLAAFEGHYKTGPAGLYLFGWYDSPKVPGEAGIAHGPALPGMLSWLVHGDTTASVRGLDEFGEDIPPVPVVFQTWHAMIGIGMVLIGLSAVGILLWWRKALWNARWFLKICVLSVLLPQIANQCGWFSAEIGRQPWIVYGLMRTKDAVSPTVHPNHIIASVIMFSIMYALLFALFIFLLNQKIHHGPDEPAIQAPSHPALQGHRAAT